MTRVRGPRHVLGVCLGSGGARSAAVGLRATTASFAIAGADGVRRAAPRGDTLATCEPGAPVLKRVVLR